MNMPTDMAERREAKQDRRVAACLTIRGCVQGVGLRPTIARLARALALAGEVRNTLAGVAVVLEGTSSAVGSFSELLRRQLPSAARIAGIDAEPIPATGRRGFAIVAATAGGALQTEVPRDPVVCPACLTEAARKGDRRHEYPFTSCADCGPRYSVLVALPFERAATTMSGFALCEDCQSEYADPNDRRFHAQTIACPRCGPKCWLTEGRGTILARGTAAVSAAAAAIAAGRIVAMKGLGGYQLLVNATNGTAVARLRLRKERPAKPMAVLVATLADAEAIAHLDDATRAALTSRAGPIVLAPARRGMLAEGVHSGLDDLGLMLPTTPLHWLLARQSPPLIATSGNHEGEPLAFDDAVAENQLARIADLFLHHDRPIERPIDDSVVRIIVGRDVTIRAARGLAPLPLPASHVPPFAVLAVGGDQKVAIALHNCQQAALGPHIGDLDELLTRERFASHVRDFCRLYDAEPKLIVHDQHSDYYTTRWAGESGLPAMAVQHHHAHVAAGMLEHGWLGREVLGVAWDGTGYGPDGTIWGGEFLRAKSTSYERVCRLRSFPLLGGEAAIREPWRAALAVLGDAIGAEAAVEFLAERGFDRRLLAPLASLGRRTALAPLTSSAGRLFDAVAAWLLPLPAEQRGQSSSDGHLAMLLEALAGGADRWTTADFAKSADEDGLIRIPPRDPRRSSAELAELDWRPLIAALVADYRRGVAAERLAARFHAALADAIVGVAAQYSALPIVLTGGVFQNRRLTELVAQRLAAHPSPLGLPGRIPPGDGGLAAGQLAVAVARLSTLASDPSS
ncbi:MAG TPA: carbamoyltransferase HypF [Pirellulaceae bacterium]|nr:carbamoyltransferase HypF [Pirellulaceae bacterium]